ncbi:hypothetical protein [uncultured Cellulomonas sp.]|uniref:hypothetical protein n=1 Tax=uncultured Cellulomonas sp. TaxID=189682 RepID=UPI0028EE938A|nr:hypothetical protein [uncultured Cellulomonas sp.]
MDGISRLAVEEIIVTTASEVDVGELYALSPAVSSVTLNGNVVGAGGIDIRRLRDVRHLALEWEAVSRTGLPPGPALESLTLLGYDAKELPDLGGRLRSLALYGAKNLVDLEGLRAMDNLRELEINDARRLTDIDALAALRDLVRFEADGCTGIHELEVLRDARNLRRLRLADCGGIASLAPIRGHNQLQALLAWGTTNIEDGDLTPLLSLPRLSELALKSRRHYSPSVSSIERARGSRRRGPTLDGDAQAET